MKVLTKIIRQKKNKETHEIQNETEKNHYHIHVFRYYDSIKRKPKYSTKKLL